MRVELLDEYSTGSPDEAPAFAARTCYEEDSPITMTFDESISRVAMDKEVYSRDEQHEKLLKQLIRRGHYSVFEHPKAVFAIEGISRACMAQITRHRHMSYSVQSQRYVEFSDADFYYPESAEDVVVQPDSDIGDETAAESMWWHYENAKKRYQNLVDDGVPEEDARMVLPIGTKVNMIVSGNPRAWMHVIDMRHAGDAQGEIRELMDLIIDDLHDWAPMTFELYEEYAKGASKKAP